MISIGFIAVLLLSGPRGVAPAACVGTLSGFTDPEDIAALPGTSSIVISQQSEDGPAKGIVILDTRRGRRTIIKNPPAAEPCTLGRGGGIGIRREGSNYRLMRIVHAAADTIEVWRVSMTGRTPRAVRTACIHIPTSLYLNDIAPLPDGGLIATHMFDRTIEPMKRNRMFLSGAPTGWVARWSARSGWSRVPNSDGAFSNGIDVSPDGRWIAFAETYGHRINRIRPSGHDRTSIRLAMQPDTVTAFGSSRFVVAGGTGAPMASTRNCAALNRSETRQGCAFPAAALTVDFETGRIRSIVRSDGASTSGLSVGLVSGSSLWLGTAFGTASSA
jgi:hypothetical protein